MRAGRLDFLATLVVVAGCASFTEVTDTDEDSVHIVVNGDDTDDELMSKARHACEIHDRVPTLLSGPEGLCVERSWFFGICTARQFVFACAEVGMK